MAGNDGAAALPGPAHTDLLRDLRQVRSGGAGRLRTMELPALRKVAVMLDYCDEHNREPAPIRDLLCRVVADLGGGDEQEEAEYLLGLAPGTALWNAGRRLEEAARLRVITVDAYRKKPLNELLALVAENVLDLCHQYGQRQARVEMEQHRHPADSRLAVQWVERFEAYYAVWTPAYALAADLEAALDHYTQEPADHLPWDPESTEPYIPEAEARGYARSALYWLTAFHLEVRRFRTKHGGLWLASDIETEQKIADTVYLIGWHNDLNDEDESWLRRHLADSRLEENDHFVDIILAFSRGQKIHTQWQAYVKQGVGLGDEAKVDSQVWNTIAACKQYCDMIDEDWLKIADWYRPATQPRRRVEPAELYERVVLAPRERAARPDD